MGSIPFEMLLSSKWTADLELFLRGVETDAGRMATELVLDACKEEVAGASNILFDVEHAGVSLGVLIDRKILAWDVYVREFSLNSGLEA